MADHPAPPGNGNAGISARLSAKHHSQLRQRLRIATPFTAWSVAKMEFSVLIILAIFLVAILYSSVGHGGASGYLAVMALLAVAPEVTRPTALTLNLFVASIATVQYYRAGHFSWRLFIPFAIASIPMAYLGGDDLPPTHIF